MTFAEAAKIGTRSVLTARTITSLAGIAATIIRGRDNGAKKFTF
jgi:hypothetical protein